MGISMSVDGSPSSCRAAARAVRALGQAVERSATGLAGVRTAASGAWSGDAAERFDQRSRRMVTAADSLATGLLAFARALDAQGDAIETARSEMRRARSIATGAGIPVAGDSFPAHGEVELEPGQEGPRDHGEAVITRARDAEETARAGFATAVESVLGLAWEGEPPPPPGRLQGPEEMLPDLPDFGITLAPGLAPGPASVPVPVPEIDLPDIDPLVDALTAPAVPLITAHLPGAIRGARHLADETKKNLQQPSGPPGKRAVVGPAKAAYAQWLEDAPEEDMRMAERLVRAGWVGGATLAGGAGAAWACTQATVTAPFMPVCADVGSRAGSIVGNTFLEILDDR